LDILYDLIQGVIQIQNAMQGRPVLSPLRDWAISPDAMNWILLDLQEREKPTVIEFGSGQSTVILAAALKHRGGQLITVEHDFEYMENIRSQISACGLVQQVEFVHAPLIDLGMVPACQSYDLSKLPEIGVDAALVDGPPLANGMLTRLAPLRWAVAHLGATGVVFLDDSKREAEQKCIAKLLSEYPDLCPITRRAEKGLAELRRSKVSPAAVID